MLREIEESRKGRKHCKGAHKRWMKGEEIEGLSGKALQRGRELSTVDQRRAISESVAHPSENGSNLEKLLIIYQASENKTLNNFTSSVLLCLTMR